MHCDVRSDNSRPIAEEVRELLSYAPETGEFIWRARPVELFKDSGNGGAAGNCARWNGKFAGTVAGRINQSDGYREIAIFGVRYNAQRLAWLIMTGYWPEHEVDHKNCDRADNHWENLREATDAENARNSVRPINNKSGFKGVSWKEANKKWAVQISVDSRKLHLGLFDTAEAAHAAYVAAARKHHGEFARAA